VYENEEDEVEEDDESDMMEEEGEPMLDDIVIERREEPFWADVDEEVEEEDRDQLGIRLVSQMQPPVPFHRAQADEQQMFNQEHAFLPP
jgi:hypothetical protein